MRRLYYAGGHVLTSNAISDALLRYGRELASAHGADIVTVPIVDQNGRQDFAQLLLGPASQILSAPAVSLVPEPDDTETVAELDRRTNRLKPSRSSWTTEPITIGEPDEFGIDRTS